MSYEQVHALMANYEEQGWTPVEARHCFVFVGSCVVELDGQIRQLSAKAYLDRYPEAREGLEQHCRLALVVLLHELLDTGHTLRPVDCGARESPL